MPEGLMSADKNGTIISCNQYGTELIGISEKDIVGTSISELFPVLDVQTELEGDVITTKEINICPDGKTIRIFITCLPIPPIGVLYLFQDAVKATFLMQDIYIDTATSFNDIYGNSPQIENVKKFAHQIAGGSSTVLITGESGTGKRTLRTSDTQQQRPSKRAFHFRQLWRDSRIASRERTVRL